MSAEKSFPHSSLPLCYVLGHSCLKPQTRLLCGRRTRWYLFGAPLSGAEGIQSEFCPGYFLGDLLSSPGIVVSSRAVSQGVMVAVIDRWIWSRELAQEHGRGATRRKGNPRNVVARDSGEDRGKPPIPQGHSSSVRLVGFAEKQTNMIAAIARRPKDILHPPGVPTENTRSCSGTFCGSKSSSEEFKIVFP